HLMKRMDLAVVVDSQQQIGLDKIFFGAWVTIFNLTDDSEHTYRIVGKDEIEPTKGYISWVSPLAKGMLGKEIGNEIKVLTPTGEILYEVVDVRYTRHA
ncbi:MAG: GreA/GreB family elongation factor, partial [Methylophilaceae bacterium]